MKSTFAYFVLLFGVILINGCNNDKNPIVNNSQNSSISNETNLPELDPGKMLVRLYNDNGALIKEEIINQPDRSKFAKATLTNAVTPTYYPYTYIMPQLAVSVNFHNNDNASMQIASHYANTTVYIGGGVSYQMGPGNVLWIYPAMGGTPVSSTQPIQVSASSNITGYIHQMTLLPLAISGNTFRVPPLEGTTTPIWVSIAAFNNGTTVSGPNTWNLGANQTTYFQAYPGTLIQANQHISVVAFVSTAVNNGRAATCIPLDVSTGIAAE
ncbi:MAG: hypothetical protein WDA22_17385 [Bacteroidota bacterium]